METTTNSETREGTMETTTNSETREGTMETTTTEEIVSTSWQLLPQATQERIIAISQRYSNNSIFVKKLLTLLALDISRKQIQQSLLNDIFEQYKRLPKNCGELIEILQDMGIWPSTFPSPLGIYNKLNERKKGGSDTHWFEKDGIVGHNKKSQTVEKEIFFAVLNMCRNLAKEKSLNEIQQRERKKDVLTFARKILDAALRGDRDEVELTLPAFDEAKEKAAAVLVEYTDAEQDTIDCIDRRLFQVKTRKKDSPEQLQARAEAAEAAEAAAKQAVEAAEAAAKQAAEAAAKQAAETAEATTKWEAEREKLRKENAETRIRLQQTAEKFNKIQALAHSFTHKPSKTELEKFLKDIQELTK